MTLKLRKRSLFPASVIAVSPIILAKAGVVYTFSLDIDQIKSTFDAYYAPVNSGLDKPIVIFADGQSNISLIKTFAWVPNQNAFIWNNTQDAVNTGSAFAPLSQTTVGIAEKMASDIADAIPGKKVYLIKNGYTGIAISHWLSGTGAPDLYANAVANLTAALAAISATKIDFYIRWQGEADTAPINTNYLQNFATMMTRYWGNSLFPRETPSIICSIADSATSGNSDGDHMNAILVGAVNADPDYRRYFYTAALSGATYWDAGNPGHMTGQGYFSAGATAASIMLNGPGRNSLKNVAIDPSTGSAVFGFPTYSAGAPITYNGSNFAAALPAPAGGTIWHGVAANSLASLSENDSFGNFTGFIGRRANGTLAAKTTLSLDDLIVTYGAQGYDGSAYSGGNAAALNFFAQAAWTVSNHSTYAGLALVPNGSTTGATYHRWDVGSYTVNGSTSGGLKFAVPAVAGSNTLTFPAGTTDFSATGGAGQYVKQVTAGGAFTVGAIGSNEVTRAMQAQGVARSVIGVTGNATANVADIQGAASQFLGVNSAGTALAFQTMSGDAALSGAAITVTKINNVDQTTAWSTYTPTVGSQGGTFTTTSATGAYKIIGKTVHFVVQITITTVGSATGFVTFTFPPGVTGNRNQNAAGKDATTGKMVTAGWASASTTGAILFYDGTSPIAAGNILLVSGVIEQQ